VKVHRYNRLSEDRHKPQTMYTCHQC